jgi:hypothetical protein
MKLTGGMYRYAHKLDLPDAVFETRSIQEIERIGVDLVLMYVSPSLPSFFHKRQEKRLALTRRGYYNSQNDILSYRKEEVRSSSQPPPQSSPLLSH